MPHTHPDLQAALKTRCVIITTQAPARYSSRGYNFISRVLSGTPSGVEEDPVTGSAHCALAVHWSKKLGKENRVLHAYQASQRGGSLDITWQTEKRRVELVGNAVAVAEGKLLLN